VTSQSNSASKPSTDTGLGEVTRRIRRRTTDLLAIGLLLVVGLVLGRQLTAWWNEPELRLITDPASVTGPGTAWTEPDDLQLGDLGQTIHRQRVTGSRQAAWEALENSTRKTANQAGWPESEPDSAERQLLERLSRKTTRTTDTTTISLHRLDGPLPMIVAVRRLLGNHRIVGWGLATRTPDNEWVTWTFAGTKNTTVETVSLPPGSRRLLAVGSGDPERLLVFAGSSNDDGWWRHFDTELNREGWESTGPPSRCDTGWTARWQHPGGHALVISARQHNSGDWHGMLNVFTPTQAGSSPQTGSSAQVQREST